MTEISINKECAGITYALAEYAKNINDGKSIKLSKRQWQNVMAKVAEINSVRDENNKIFTGGTNLDGPSNKNFVIRSNKINFSEEELNLILTEMGIDKIKGLSVEKNPQQTVTTQLSDNNRVSDKPIDEEINRPLPPAEIKLENQPRLNLFTQNITLPKIEVKQQAESLNFTPTPAQPKAGKEPDALPQSAQTLNNTSEITEATQTYSTKNEENQNVNYRVIEEDNTKIVREYNISDYKNGRETVSGTHDKYIDALSVLNKKGKVIASLQDGKYFVKDKPVSQEEFDKYTNKKGYLVQLTAKKSLIISAEPQSTQLTPKSDLDITNLSITPIDTRTRAPFEIKGSPVEVPNQKIHQLVQNTAEKYNLDANLLLAIIKKESRFQNTARSSAGAMGLMQLMPATARGYGVKNPWDPAQNIDGGARVLKTLLKEYDGDVMLALAGYNYGIGNVNKKLKGKPKNIASIYDKLPFETKDYVQKVYSDYIATKQKA